MKNKNKKNFINTAQRKLKLQALLRSSQFISSFKSVSTYAAGNSYNVIMNKTVTKQSFASLRKELVCAQSVTDIMIYRIRTQIKQRSNAKFVIILQKY